MKKSPNLLIPVIVSVVLTLTIACNLLTGFEQDLEGVKSTAAALATEVQGDGDVVATAKAMVTQVADSDMLATAKALVTEAGESGVVETMQALATEKGPQVQETLQALATSQGPGLIATAQAMLTQAPSLPHVPPQDIPLIEGEKENFVSVKDTVSYQTPVPFADVVAFYKSAMPQQGWTLNSSESLESDKNAVLTYEKENKQAILTINLNPANNKTIVVIYIQSK